MNKILTVVIPTYNMEKYLANCITSLLIPDKRVLDLLEIIVVNDGSKDHSSIIAHQFHDRFPETVKVIDKDNGNYGSCVNKGLTEAKGKYIKILDADDSFDSDNFTYYLQVLKESNADIVISDYNLVNGNGKLIEHRTFVLPKNKEFSINRYFEEIKHIQMHAVAYKTDNLRRLGYLQTEGISYTDMEWIFAPIVTVKSGYYFPNVIYKYLVGRAGQTVDIKVYHKKWHDREMGLWTMIHFYHNNDLTHYSEELRRYLEEKIIDRIHGLYLSHLIVNRNNELALEFDQQLRSVSAELYEKTENIKIHRLLKKLPFVKKWRNTKILPTKATSYLYMTLLSIKKHF